MKLKYVLIAAVGIAVTVLVFMSLGDPSPAPRQMTSSDPHANCPKPATGATKPAPVGVAGQVVGWRGNGQGQFKDVTPPVRWTGEADDKNIKWTAEVGKNRYGSVIVVGNRLLLTSEPDTLLCLDADSGKKLWEKTNGLDQLPQPSDAELLPADTGNATPVPVSDGKFVYASFGSGIVACYDLDGNRKWIAHVDAEPLQYGRSGSPVLCGGKLVVSLGHLRALDTATGAVVWQNDDAKECYGTPLAAKIGDTDVLLTPSGQVVRASDGKVINKSLGSLSFASPVRDGDIACFIDVSAYAIRLPQKASDDLGLKRLWQLDLEGIFYASPVIHNGLVYAVSNEGMFFIIDMATGEKLSQTQLEIPSASGIPGTPATEIFSSVTLAGPYLYVFNFLGDSLVLEASREAKQVSRNRLDEGTGGNPVFIGDRMYIRGEESLYCIGK